MAESGLDVKTWLTVLGVFIVFFVLPGCTLEYDRRKKLRELRRSESPAPDVQALERGRRER